MEQIVQDMNRVQPQFNMVVSDVEIKNLTQAVNSYCNNDVDGFIIYSTYNGRTKPVSIARRFGKQVQIKQIHNRNGFYQEGSGCYGNFDDEQVYNHVENMVIRTKKLFNCVYFQALENKL